MTKTITITLTEPQYQALASAVALHEAEDDDGWDPKRRGTIMARKNAWRKINEAWYAQRAERKQPVDVVRLADDWLEAHKVTESWRIINMLRDHIVRNSSG